MLRLFTNVRARAISASCCSSRWRTRRCETGEGEIERHAVLHDEAETLAILRHQCEAALQRVRRRRCRHWRAVQQHATRHAVTPHPEQVHQQLRAPCPHQATDAQHFAGTHRQRNVSQECRDARPLRHAERFDLEQRPAGRAATARVEIFDRAPDHQPDDFRRIRLRRGQGADTLAVAQHGDAVCDAEHFIQLVRNIDARHAAAAQIPHQREQSLDLLARECRRRLVQYQHLRTLGDGACDFDELSAGHAEITNEGLGVQLHTASAQDLACTRVHFVPVDETEPPREPPEQQVLGHGHVGEERELLVNDRDAGVLRVARRRKVRGLSPHEDLALVAAARVHPAEKIDES